MPPLPETGCPIFLEIRNPWGKVRTPNSPNDSLLSQLVVSTQGPPKNRQKLVEVQKRHENSPIPLTGQIYLMSFFQVPISQIYVAEFFITVEDNNWHPMLYENNLFNLYFAAKQILLKTMEGNPFPGKLFSKVGLRLV